MLCRTCAKRTTCRALCPQAETWAGQDEVDRFRIGRNWVVLVRPEDLTNSDLTSTRLLGALADLEQESVTLGSEEWAIVQKCGLSPREGQCVRLHYWEGRTIPDIAKQLNLSAGSVCGYLNRGRAKIAAFLTKAGTNIRKPNFTTR